MVHQATAVKADRGEMLADFFSLTQRCCDIGDYDPFHLLIRKVTKGMDQEEALWFSCLFIAHYNLGSAWIAFHKTPIYHVEEWGLPIETARRALFGGRIYRHLRDLVAKAKAVGGLHKFFTQGFQANRYYNWNVLRSNIGSVYGSGRWAEYTFAEVLQKAHNFNACPPDMGLKGASGPRNGLSLIMGSETEEASQELMGLCRKNLNVPWFDYAVLESVACDFNSLNKGKYYIGRDIDREQYRLLKAERAVSYKIPELWAALEAVFPHKYLGHLNGWEGIDKDRLKHYCLTGEVIDR